MIGDGSGVASSVPWPAPYPQPAADAAQAPAQEKPAEDKPHIWAQKGFRFHDLLDIVNPLQHIPVVSAIYRWITGESIGNLPRVAGDALYGGVIGAVSGLVGVLVKEETGKDIGENLIALVSPDHEKTKPDQAEAVANSGSTSTPMPTITRTASIVTAQADPAPAISPASAAPAMIAQAELPVLAKPATQIPPAPTPSVVTPSVATSPVVTQSGAPSQGVPDHAPIPLARPVFAPPSSGTPQSAVSLDPAVKTFLAQQAAQQRAVQQGSAPSGDRTLTTRPIPLELPPGALSAAPRPRAPYSPVSQIGPITRPGVTPSAQTAPSNPAPPDSSPSVPAVPGAGPVDISQQMMDGLDKYIALQKQRDGARGAQLNLSQ